MAYTVKKSACNARDLASIPVLGRSPGEGHGHPPLYPCLENPMDGGAWWAIVHGLQRHMTEQLHFHFSGKEPTHQCRKHKTH